MWKRTEARRELVECEVAVSVSVQGVEHLLQLVRVEGHLNV